jgi:hypothetical protein
MVPLTNWDTVAMPERLATPAYVEKARGVEAEAEVVFATEPVVATRTATATTAAATAGRHLFRRTGKARGVTYVVENSVTFAPRQTALPKLALPERG